MASNPAGACKPIWSTTNAPQSPPLGDVAGVAEALHQFRPGSAHPLGTPAGARRLARETVARHRGDNHVEGVGCARAVCRGIGKRVDDLQLLDDRAGPSVRNKERQSILMLRTNMNKMNLQTIDLRDKLRQGTEPGLAPAPIVIGRPIVCEILHRRERYALGWIGNRLAVRPLRRCNPPAELEERLFRNVNSERPDWVVSVRCAGPCRCGGAWRRPDRKAECAGGAENGAPVGLGEAVHSEAPVFGYGRPGGSLLSEPRSGGSRGSRA